MIRLVDELQNQLARKFHKKHCILTGSGTTAIYALLKSLRLKKDSVVLLPGICCFAPAYAVKYAGLKVDFCDIALSDGCLTPESVKVAITKNPQIKVVIGVHLYGNVMDTDPLVSICQKHNIVFIEDACQAYGSMYKGKPCGSLGHFSILSFGHTKILEAGAGGALLMDDEEIACLVKMEVEKLSPPETGQAAKLFDDHRRKYYAVGQKAKLDSKIKPRFGLLWRGYKDAFVFGLDHKFLKKIKALLKQEKRIIAHRKKLNLVYQKALQGQPRIQILKSKHPAVSWRFTCLIKHKHLFELCDTLRKEGFDISHWYPNLANMFVLDFQRRLKNSNAFERHVVNMWVDQTKNEKYVVKLCNQLKENLSIYP